MEAASENKGRGRPQKFPREAYLAAAAEGPRTRRGQQDHIFARIAITLIRERYPEEDWLCGESPKWTLLAELGRVRAQHGERAFWQVTELVLEHRPKVKDAIRTIRRVRIGGTPHEDKPGQT
jgi:hypothetical protein